MIYSRKLYVAFGIADVIKESANGFNDRLKKSTVKRTPKDVPPLYID